LPACTFLSTDINSLKLAMLIDSGGVTGRLAAWSRARVRCRMLGSIQPCRVAARNAAAHVSLQRQKCVQPLHQWCLQQRS
jgi:hypothetical protein